MLSLPLSTHKYSDYSSCSFKNEKDNKQYKGLGASGEGGAIDLFEKMFENLEEFTTILEVNNDNFIIKNENENENEIKEIPLAKALKQLMSAMYPDFKPKQKDSKDSKESKDSHASNLIVYITDNFQICFVCVNENERQNILNKIRYWKLSDLDIKALKNPKIVEENEKLIQPAMYTTNKNSFYLTLCQAYGELYFSIGDDANSPDLVKNFFETMGLKQDVISETDRSLDRAQYCNGLFTFYNNPPIDSKNRIYITRNAKFFINDNINKINNTYYVISKGIVKEVQKIDKEKIAKQKKKGTTKLKSVGEPFD